MSVRSRHWPAGNRGGHIQHGSKVKREHLWAGHDHRSGGCPMNQTLLNVWAAAEEGGVAGADPAGVTPDNPSRPDAAHSRLIAALSSGPFLSLDASLSVAAAAKAEPARV